MSDDTSDPDPQGIVDQLLLCIVNESGLYKANVLRAQHVQTGMVRPEVAAMDCLRMVNTWLAAERHRITGTPTAQDLLRASAGIADYYVKHIKEL